MTDITIERTIMFPRIFQNCLCVRSFPSWNLSNVHDFPRTNPGFVGKYRVENQRAKIKYTPQASIMMRANWMNGSQKVLE